MADLYIKLCGFSLWCGISGLVLLIAAVVVAFRHESIGLVTSTRYLVLPVSFGAILLGAIASGRAADANNQKARKRALTGLILGAIVAGIVILVMLVVMVFFLPLLLVAGW